jgi:transcriptional regulator with XRE-family HTH domain
MIPLQVRVLRKQREWSQARLAKEANLTQGVISRAEDPENGNLTVNTLVRIGAGFDCAFVGRFVPYSELGKWYIATQDERSLEVPAFDEDHGFIERKEMGMAAPARIPHRGVVNARGSGRRLLSIPALDAPSYSSLEISEPQDIVPHVKLLGSNDVKIIPIRTEETYARAQ